MIIEIGGLSDHKIIGEDTIRGHSLKRNPVAKGKIPLATTTVIKKPKDAFEILWIDTKGKRRVGVIRAKKRKGVET